MSCLPLHLETKTRYWCRNAMKSTCRQVQEWGGGRNESSKNHGLQMQIPRAVLQDLFIQQPRIILTSLMIYTHSRGHCFNLDKTWDQVQCQTECRWSKAVFLIHSLIFTEKKALSQILRCQNFFFFTIYPHKHENIRNEHILLPVLSNSATVLSWNFMKNKSGC